MLPERMEPYLPIIKNSSNIRGRQFITGISDVYIKLRMGFCVRILMDKNTSRNSQNEYVNF